MTHYIAKAASARMPSSCHGTYKHCAVLEIELGRDDVSMISSRARGVVRVVKQWPAANDGLTERSAHRRNMTEARALAASLNARAVSAP